MTLEMADFVQRSKIILFRPEAPRLGHLKPPAVLSYKAPLISSFCCLNAAVTFYQHRGVIKSVPIIAMIFDCFRTCKL